MPNLLSGPMAWSVEQASQFDLLPEDGAHVLPEDDARIVATLTGGLERPLRAGNRLFSEAFPQLCRHLASIRPRPARFAVIRHGRP